MDPQQMRSSFLTGSPAPTQDEKTWGMIAHLSGIAALLIGLPFLGPLIVMLVKGKDSAWVNAHAKEALNVQITAFIAYLVCTPLVLCLGLGALIALGVGIAVVVFNILAALKANNGEMYRYPATLRLVK
jgi:uncharacterized Tic20 family protein